MKKTHVHNVLSDVKCKDCEKFLKLRIVEQKPTADRCFKCHVKHNIKTFPDKFKTVQGIPRLGKIKPIKRRK